ncbi:Uncharacterised protein [Streptococcus dysgalactiae]|nr:hypothetical protein SDD27957_08825 [Streptococcus dysgalactiae subsp. dysgalactiae ATCC 27957]SUN47255.1 Uncharacterised protein [Streptococcus dysgalactiae subsp. dysgalactiae]SUN51840.1 Uncharacterised protein [Streptococcus dysgalactiae]SUN55971.1 Uncharacterised protein [Streptococcus dysgalactiae]VDZ41019.1 Uncharacterised protein [Streptococcus dysgalactiae subsp. dysgalactiae]
MLEASKKWVTEGRLKDAFRYRGTKIKVSSLIFEGIFKPIGLKIRHETPKEFSAVRAP